VVAAKARVVAFASMKVPVRRDDALELEGVVVHVAQAVAFGGGGEVVPVLPDGPGDGVQGGPVAGLQGTCGEEREARQVVPGERGGVAVRGGVQAGVIVGEDEGAAQSECVEQGLKRLREGGREAVWGAHRFILKFTP